jgi:FixJ family two-component response regulator
MLLDVKMPGISGFDVVTDALEVDSEIGIIMLSGLNDATTASICMQRGAMDYLTKPIEITELSTSVGMTTSKRHTRIQNSGFSVPRKTPLIECGYCPGA